MAAQPPLAGTALERKTNHQPTTTMNETENADAKGRLAAAGYAGVDWRPASEMPRSEYGESWYDLKPGMLLRQQDGSVILVGHTNENGGGCDCCRVIDVQVSAGTISEWGWSPGWEPA